MNKRDFLKTAVLTATVAQLPMSSFAKPKKRNVIKNWVWVDPSPKDTDDELVSRYISYKASGVTGIFFENDSERHFRAAKAQGLEAHRWIWTFNRAEMIPAHPEWYSVSRKGHSCADKPPYVNYYRWLCPSRPEVQSYLEQVAASVLDKDYVDGIHLDYVRYCDVILPVNLWSVYKLDETRELPDYDFCYCDTCKAKFKEKYNLDIDQIEYPDACLSWRLFRYSNITRVVNSIATIAHKHKKGITAAVFPTPEVARRNVRQDWTNWNLDGVCPMIYHGFYKEGVSWIGDAVAEGVHFLAGKFPLYAGIYLPDFKTDEEVKSGIQYAFKNGAAGISFFGHVTPGVLDALKHETGGGNHMNT